LLQMLRCTADENPENWPHRLPTVMAAYRMTVHQITGVTPNMAMLGREVLLPASLIARPPVEPANTTVPFVKDLRDVMRDAHERIRQATKKEAGTQRKYYDDRSRMTRFYEGQKVWLLAKATRTSAIQKVDTLMDWSMENSLVQKSSCRRTTSCF